jgi:hypothetical protein
MNWDWVTVVISVLSSLGFSTGGVWWLGKKWVERRLELEKIDWQGEVQKQVETELADRAADREYALDARRRLYTAIGPLRFQLLMACRELAGRIRAYSLHPYSMDTRGYYGQTTLYRLLRPLALSELIERQMSFADFSVDPSAIELLRFKRAAAIALSDSDPILDHPNATWYGQDQHLFANTIDRVASAIIIREDESNSRVLEFAEFEQFISNKRNLSSLSPLPEMLDSFNSKDMPILWIRLILYGYLCAHLVKTIGLQIGFDQIEYDVLSLLPQSQDAYTIENLKAFLDTFNNITSRGL